MKKLIILSLILCFALTSCVAKVEVEEKPEEKIEVIEETEEEVKAEEPKEEAPEEEPKEEVPEEKEENEIPAVTIPEDDKIVPEENEVPAVIIPDENELEALPTDFSDITEEELQDLLEGFLSEGTVVELPILPIE